MSEQAIENIRHQLEKHNKTLERQSEKLETIQQTLQRLAVQDEQIRQMQAEQQALWKKFDVIVGSDGVLPRIEKHQASCPRKQIQVLWYVVIPLGVSHLALAAKLVEMMGS